MNPYATKRGIYLSTKVLAVISTALTLLGLKEALAAPQQVDPKGSEIHLHEELVKKQLKPKLVLKPNFADPNKGLIARHGSHSSHSSHSSHQSHRSHYSSSSGDGDGGGAGVVIGALAVGAVAYGVYQLGKNKGPKK
jgi:hypothetical protein